MENSTRLLYCLLSVLCIETSHSRQPLYTIIICQIDDPCADSWLLRTLTMGLELSMVFASVTPYTGYF